MIDMLSKILWQFGHQNRYGKTAVNKEEWIEGNEREVAQIVSSIDEKIEKIGRRLHDHRVERRRDTFWHSVEALGLWAAALIGGWAIINARVDANKQQKIMADQIEIMKTQFRPQLSLDQKVETPQVAGGTFEITPVWKNNGGGEAKGFTAWDNRDYFPLSVEPMPSSFLKMPERYHPIPQTLEVQESESQATIIIPYAVAEAAADGKGKVVFWGHVQWKGPFYGDPIKERYYCYALNFFRGSTGLVNMTSPYVYKDECTRSK